MASVIFHKGYRIEHLWRITDEQTGRWVASAVSEEKALAKIDKLVAAAPDLLAACKAVVAWSAENDVPVPAVLAAIKRAAGTD